jgi:hypothetical protein
MDSHSTPNNKIRKAHIRIVLYMLMLMTLHTKTNTCTMIKYKRYESLIFTVSTFIFSVATGLMQSRVLYKTSTGSLALTSTVNGWLRNRIFQSSDTQTCEYLKKLARGPIFTIVTYQGYDINGYTFYTEQ